MLLCVSRVESFQTDMFNCALMSENQGAKVACSPLNLNVVPVLAMASILMFE